MHVVVGANIWRATFGRAEASRVWRGKMAECRECRSALVLWTSSWSDGDWQLG
ncbi:hypothetical protein RB213_010483 [Colletotrichum asianum]